MHNALPAYSNLYRRNACRVMHNGSRGLGSEMKSDFISSQWLEDCFLNYDQTDWQKALFATTPWQMSRNAHLYDKSEVGPVFTFSQAEKENL